MTGRARSRVLLCAAALAVAFASSTGSAAGIAPAVRAELAPGSPLQLIQHVLAPPPGATNFGTSVALSADANTALIGGPGRVVWTYTHTGSGWVLAQPLATTGGDLAISADGNTALLGAPCENKTSTALVFVRARSTWTQQDPPLTPNDAQGSECDRAFGSALALSADGNTALIGASADASHRGAAWVFVRSGSTWTQQGPKLSPADESGPGAFGESVALSADGNTALIGAPEDGAPPRTLRPDPHKGAGGAWIFTRSGSSWTQRQRLVPSDEVLSEDGRGLFGSAVALSGDSSTALVGGEADNDQGAAWVFGHAGAFWVQQGPKLIGEHQKSGFGGEVALSQNGTSALISQVYSGYSYSDEYGNGFEGWSRGGAGTMWPFTRVGPTWIREAPAKGPNPKGASEEFAYGFALSASGGTALIGAPDGFDDPGAAWLATLAPMPPNSFSMGLLRIAPSGALEQELSASAAGSFSAAATVSSHAPSVITPRERRLLARCHNRRRRHRPRCPRAHPVTYGLATAEAAGSGIQTLVVRPAPAMHRALDSYQELKVTLTIGFQPSSGPAPSAQSREIVVELGRRERF